MLKTYDPKVRDRHSIRLPAFDYAEPGLYFVTICTNGKKHLFGDVRNEKMILNKFGYIANKIIRNTRKQCKNIRMRAWIVMPNHVHMIVNIRRRGTPVACPGDAKDIVQETISFLPERLKKHGTSLGHATGVPLRRDFGSSAPGTISTVVGQYKSMVTKWIKRLGYTGTLWQRNYYERIIQTDEGLFDTIEYIKNNPKNWGRDEMNTG